MTDLTALSKRLIHNTIVLFGRHDGTVQILDCAQGTRYRGGSLEEALKELPLMPDRSAMPLVKWYAGIGQSIITCECGQRFQVSPTTKLVRCMECISEELRLEALSKTGKVCGWLHHLSRQAEEAIASEGEQ